jgi:hypothetical protein
MKWMAAALLVVVLMLQYRLWLSGDGVREVARLSESVEHQKSENEELLARNQQLIGGHGGHRGTRAQRARHDRAQRNLLPGRARATAHHDNPDAAAAADANRAALTSG